MSANFRVGIEQLGPDVTRIVFAGDIDLRAEPQLKHLADSALEGDRKVLIDLSDADFIDSTILSFVLDGAKRVNERSGRFVVLCPDAGMRRLFEIAGLNLIVPVVDTLERASAHLGTASWSSQDV